MKLWLFSKGNEVIQEGDGQFLGAVVAANSEEEAVALLDVLGEWQWHMEGSKTANGEEWRCEANCTCIGEALTTEAQVLLYTACC